MAEPAQERRQHQDLRLPVRLPRRDEGTAGATDDEEEESSNTTVEATFKRASPKEFLDDQPQEKLRALLDITTALTKTLNFEALLPQIADELFKVFKQADRCFIIELDEDNRLRPVVTQGPPARDGRRAVQPDHRPPLPGNAAVVPERGCDRRTRT